MADTVVRVQQTMSVVRSNGVPAIVRTQTAVPRVVRVGVPGPQGAPGASGAGGAGYIHTQATPALTWTINHNLGFRPAVAVFNSGSVQVNAEVQHLSEHQTLVSFVLPTAGFARLN